MIIPGLEDAVFLRRENRFVARVLWRGREAVCHVPNSGRLAELLVEGTPARVKPSSSDGRTSCGLVMVQNLGHWVVINANMANQVAFDAIQQGLVPGLEHAENLRREVVCGESRFDMACQLGGQPCYIEVKCSTLQHYGVAMFPDAPTERGWKHLRGLTALAQQGTGCCYVLFVLQHPIARQFTPNIVTDPMFGKLLYEAIAAGVQVHALVCRIDENSLEAISAFAVNGHF